MSTGALTWFGLRMFGATVCESYSLSNHFLNDNQIK
jgi:hypothetical protein